MTPQNIDWEEEFDSRFLLVDYENESLGGNYRSVKSFIKSQIEAAYGRGVADGLNSTAPQDPKLREIWSRLYEGKELPHQP